MRNSASQSIAAVTVNVTSGVGEISNNTIYNYARVAALSGGNSIKDRQ
jgi:hypothetical protein